MRLRLRLKSCDVHDCEATCCHDGVYLDAGEEARLHRLVERTPELRALLPAEFVVDGWWNGRYFGRKTATRPHAYRNAAYPAHFARTRCVFADTAGLCELQKLAVARGLHPWRYKPYTCWMFPLGEKRGRAVPSSADSRDDPYRVPGYVGCVSVVPCGRHDPAGRPWEVVLARELEHFAHLRELRDAASPAGTRARRGCRTMQRS
jgi:hypothetical protein